jgi:phosphotransferase system enzyme I (PtsI)
MEDQEHQEMILKGIGGSPGICIGKAYLVDKEGVDVIKKYVVPQESRSAEVGRFKTAVKNAREALQQIIDKTPEEFRQHAQILETHILLLEDKMLYDRTIDLIEKERVNAEWALKKVVSQVKPMFESMSDDYLKQRARTSPMFRTASWKSGGRGPGEYCPHRQAGDPCGTGPVAG